MFSFPPIFNHDEIAARQAALARLMSERLSALAERVFVQAKPLQDLCDQIAMHDGSGAARLASHTASTRCRR